MNKLPEYKGMSRTRQYRIWNCLKFRCLNKKLKYYGAKGIIYDPKWETFAGFWNDMKEGYADNLCIDRIDGNGNYCKENCRWATYSQNIQNTSRSTWLTYNGKTMVLSDWAKELKVTKQTLIQRIYKNKEPIELALSRGNKKLSLSFEEIKKYLSKGITQKEIAKKFGVAQSLISYIKIEHEK